VSAAAQTKIFGISLKLDPKILVGALIALAAALFWYNSRGDDEGNGSSAAVRPQATQPAVPAPAPHRHPVRRSSTTNDKSTLRMQPIDASSGKVDPTLRLDLLARLQSVQTPSNERNIFEAGQAADAGAEALKPIKGPIIKPGPLPPAVPTQPINGGGLSVNIPLKYYGFAKPASKGDPNRGFFLEGDNVLLASEGDVVEGRYLVVELNANAAKLEDTQLKQGATLPVVPEAAAE